MIQVRTAWLVTKIRTVYRKLIELRRVLVNQYTEFSSNTRPGRMQLAHMKTAPAARSSTTDQAVKNWGPEHSITWSWAEQRPRGTYIVSGTWGVSEVVYSVKRGSTPCPQYFNPFLIEELIPMFIAIGPNSAKAGFLGVFFSGHEPQKHPLMALDKASWQHPHSGLRNPPEQRSRGVEEEHFYWVHDPPYCMDTRPTPPAEWPPSGPSGVTPVRVWVLTRRGSRCCRWVAVRAPAGHTKAWTRSVTASARHAKVLGGGGYQFPSCPSGPRWRASAYVATRSGEPDTSGPRRASADTR